MNDQGIENQELRNAVRMALVPGIGPRIRKALLDRFETAEAVFAANSDALQAVQGVGSKLSRAVRDPEWAIKADDEIIRCREMGVSLAFTGCSELSRNAVGNF